MKVSLEIPEEFVYNFFKDRFADCFERASAEITHSLKNGELSLLGNYELETFDMLKKAFGESTIISLV